MTTVAEKIQERAAKFESQPTGTGTNCCRCTVRITHIDTLGRPLPQGISVAVYDEHGNKVIGETNEQGISEHKGVHCGEIFWELGYTSIGSRFSSICCGRLLITAENTITNEKVRNKDVTKEPVEALKVSVAVDKNEVTATYANNCGCEEPTENYPYRQETFDLIKEMAPIINSYSSLYGVPPIAVAGSIADEYNTRRGFKRFVDWLQDDVLLNFMPNFAIEFDVVINANSKLLNATKHDLGVGNIKLETAKKIYDNHRNEFNNLNWDYTAIVDYLRTRDGTAHMAAIYIAEAKQKLSPYLQGYSDCKKEAVFITYYKQGPSYLARFLKAKETDPNRRISPGEGCRVCLQRSKFLEIFSSFTPIYWDSIGEPKYYA